MKACPQGPKGNVDPWININEEGERQRKRKEWEEGDAEGKRGGKQRERECERMVKREGNLKYTVGW